MTKANLYEFLKSTKLGVVGSIAADGVPQAAVVGIAVTPELEIVFDTLRSSRKYRNLIANPAASLVVWADAVTVQLEGVARELSGDELGRYQAIYFEAWPDGPSRLSWDGITYFAIRPAWARYSDFTPTPALIEEFRF